MYRKTKRAALQARMAALRAAKARRRLERPALEHVEPIGKLISRQVAQSWINAENETLAKFKQAQMTPAQEREYIAKLGYTVGA